MQNMQAIKPKDIIEIILRRRWYIIIPFCLSMIAGIYLVLVLPKIYSAKTVVLLQPQGVNTEFIRSVTNAEINAMVNTISQQILSQTNIQKIINEFKLFSGPKFEKMLLEDKIGNLRQSIAIDVGRSASYRSEIESFSIGFKGREPEIVMKVTNALAKNFINESLKIREKQVTSTSEFFDKELSAIRKKLKESEQALNDYKKKYMGGLPEQLENNLRIINRLQVQLVNRQSRVQVAKNRLVTIENEISGRQNLQTSGGVGEPGAGNNLNQLVAQLKQLQNRYTEQHPDIISLKKRIADLKNQVQPPIENIEYTNLKKEIKRLEAENLDLMKKISHYEVLVDSTPKREQELMSLKNSYDSINGTYSSFLEKKQEAKLSVKLEKKQKMDQFRILDPARLPERSSEPDMVRLFLTVIAASLGIGGGLAFMLEYFDTSIRKPDDIEISIGLPVLSTIPFICQPKDIRKKRFNQIVSCFSILVSSILLILFYMLVFIGEERTVGLAEKFFSI